ncbi:MAG TPA: right-handed parallel beta-helix repeat-containing protein [Polyangia bacterium]|nr:right-handed parallel beta-helix repeat-containing protein [Polyangia bacterium]
MAALSVGALLATGGRAWAVAPTVTFDDNTTNGNCTLREAIRSVNEQRKIDACNWTAGDTTVYLANLTYSISSAAGLGSITITAPSINIFGAGYRVSTIDFGGSNTASLIVAPSDGSALITDVTMQNSSTTAVRIDTAVSVTLTKVKINHMGSLYNGGSCIKLIAGHVDFDNSEMADCGGTGIVVSEGASANVVQSTITRSQGERGGAIQNAGRLRVERSTLGANVSTVYGAAILNLGTAAIYGSTIAYNNSGTSGYASGALDNTATGSMTIQYSIVANNIAKSAPFHANCFVETGASAITSRGYNVDGEQAGYNCFASPQATDVTGDPRLNRDGNNSPIFAGGIGAVYVPAPTSVAERTIPSSTTMCQIPDQRGVARFHLANCDIGATERLEVLMVNGSPPMAGDIVLNSLLGTIGANLTSVTDTAATASMAINKALVVISESVTSANVNTKFRDTSTPVLNLEPLLVDDLRMTGPTQGTNYDVTTGTTVTMTGARGGALEVPHLFGSVDSPVVVIGSTQNMGWIKAPSGTNPVISATSSSDTSRKMLIKFSQGSTMYNGFVAPGARTTYFATDAACAYSNADGKTMLTEVMVYAAAP